MVEQQITEVLTRLAEKLGIASEKIWEWALLNAKVTLWQDVTFSIITIILTISTLFWIKSYHKRYPEGWCTSMKDTVLLIWGAINIALVIVSIVYLFEIIQIAFNPEYFALKDILKQF